MDANQGDVESMVKLVVNQFLPSEEAKLLLKIPLVGLLRQELLGLLEKIKQEVKTQGDLSTGITRNRDDVKLLADAGIHAVLVGESLMRSPNIGAALDALRGVA